MKKVLLMIVFLFLILGLYFIFDSFVIIKQSSTKKVPQPTEVATLDIRQMNKFMRPVTDSDHIRGKIEAPVKMVEFADFECEFCKKLHQTMKEIINESETEGKVAWVYRHAFNDTVHTKTRTEAEASECANELGGNDAFWSFADTIFEVTPSGNRLDLTLLPKIAKQIGLDEEEFNRCLESRRYQQKVSQDLADAMIAGARGTPYVVIIGPNDKRYDFSGAQTKNFIKNLIELAAEEK